MLGRTKQDITLKMLVLGESGVGKTSLITRFAEDKFNPVFVTTIGVDFKNKILSLHQKKVRVQVWDTAGQERYRTIAPAYFKNVKGVVIVFSLLDRNSFESVNYWIKSLEENATNNVTRILVGNKIDTPEKRVIEEEDARSFAELNNLEYYETSAKTGIGVNNIFYSVANTILTKQPNLLTEPKKFNNIITADQVKTTNKRTKTDTCCS